MTLYWVQLSSAYGVVELENEKMGELCLHTSYAIFRNILHGPFFFFSSNLYSTYAKEIKVLRNSSCICSECDIWISLLRNGDSLDIHIFILYESITQYRSFLLICCHSLLPR